MRTLRMDQDRRSRSSQNRFVRQLQTHDIRATGTRVAVEVMVLDFDGRLLSRWLITKSFRSSARVLRHTEAMPDLTAYVSAIPALGATLKLLTSTFGLGLERRARKHAELLAVIPDGVETGRLRTLLADELDAIGKKGEGRLRRKVDGATVAALIFVALVTTPIVWFLWTYPWHFLPSGEVGLPRTLALLVGVFSALLMMAGLGSLWTEPDDEAVKE